LFVKEGRRYKKKRDEKWEINIGKQTRGKKKKRKTERQIHHN